MKKTLFSTVFASVLVMLSLGAMPAQAAALTLSAKSVSSVRSAPAHVHFSVKASTKAKVKVVITHKGKKVRTLTAHRSGSHYVVTWNLRSSSNKRVATGTYAYAMVATTSHSRRTVRGHVKVPAPPVAPIVPIVPTPPVVPAPPTVPASSSAPATPVAPTPPAVTPTIPPTPPATPPVTPPAPPAVTPLDRWFGAWIPGSPNSMTPLTALESEVGSKASVVHYFTNTMYGFDASLANAVVSHGSTPLVTLEFWNPANGVNQPSLSLKSISGGSMDTYLHTYAKNAKAFGKTLWLRPFHEMNGNWYPWGGTVNGNSPADLVVAWKHVKDIFTAEGATNVKFVWCPNASSAPNTAANSISAYWPGDDYVDYIGLDGYNWGGTSWTSFSGVFTKSYAAVTALSSKPVMIVETGSSETGGSKSAWIADMFKVIPTSFPHIVGVTWFDENKEHDWRVDSSATSLAAFKLGLSAF